MVDQLKTGSDWLADKQKEFASQSVVYRRGANSVTLDAMVPKQESVVEEDGAIVTTRSRDFIFLANDLILNSLVEKPKRGDQIEWDGSVFEVLPINGEAVWKWSDHFNKQIAVHTQEVKVS